MKGPVTIQISEEWKSAYPGARVGFLALRNVANPEQHGELKLRKAALEAGLRARFEGAGREALRALPTMQAYSAYYNRFKKTYHVLLQLESVALKGRPLPSVAALVEAMFMAELQNGLLTAGHDLAAVQGPVLVSVATGEETYTLLNGRVETLKPGDMAMADDLGVISSILYGPDARTQLVPGTRSALFAVYAPPGIETQAVRRHLRDIYETVRVFAPGAVQLSLDVFEA